MTTQAADLHRKAAEHHQRAARHHLAAAKHHEAGNHELAARHALFARAYGELAYQHATEAALARRETRAGAPAASTT